MGRVGSVPPDNIENPYASPRSALDGGPGAPASEMPADQDLLAFVGTNGRYYLDAWRDAERGSRPRWNWGAGIFGPGWFFYRKMYKAGVLLLLAFGIGDVAIDVLLGLLGISLPRSSIWLLDGAIHVVFGFIGNQLYLRRAIAVIRSLPTQEPNPTKRRFDLQRAGGTSVVGALLGMIIKLVLRIGHFLLDNAF